MDRCQARSICIGLLRQRRKIEERKDSLLVEIGTEEIPAGYIQPALDGLANHLSRKLSGHRIAHGEVRTYGTPRRLVIRVDDVASRQTVVTEEVLGPPERIAFDGEGRDDRAGLKIC